MCMKTRATVATPSPGLQSYADAGIASASATSFRADPPNCPSNSAMNPAGA